MTSSTLRFRPKIENMGKMLRCRAENPVMPASQMEDTWSLDINCKYIETMKINNIHFVLKSPNHNDNENNLIKKSNNSID